MSQGLGLRDLLFAHETSYSTDTCLIAECFRILDAFELVAVTVIIVDWVLELTLHGHLAHAKSCLTLWQTFKIFFIVFIVIIIVILIIWWMLSRLMLWTVESAVMVWKLTRVEIVIVGGLGCRSYEVVKFDSLLHELVLIFWGWVNALVHFAGAQGDPQVLSWCQLFLPFLSRRLYNLFLFINRDRFQVLLFKRLRWCLPNPVLVSWRERHPILICLGVVHLYSGFPRLTMLLLLRDFALGFIYYVGFLDIIRFHLSYRLISLILLGLSTEWFQLN